jgi:hypothetical protein
MISSRERRASHGRLGSEFVFFGHGRVSENPGIFAAASLRRIHDERAFFQGDTGKPAGQYENVFAIKDIGAQIDVPTFEMVIDQSRDT